MLKTLSYQVTRALLWLLFKLLGRIRMEARENVPRKGPAILAPNHRSDCDPPAVAVAAPRLVHFMAKEELFRMPVLGRMIRVLNAFPVKPASADRAALRRAEELLRAGQALVIFPEGQLSPSGSLQEFQGGAALLALRTGAPIIPVYLGRTEGIIPYGQVIPRWSPRRVVVRFGPPISLADLAAGVDRRTALAEGTARLRDAIVALANEPAGRSPRNSVLRSEKETPNDGRR